MAHKIKTTWNGVTHDSRDDAAEANHVETQTMRWRLKQGYTSDADMDAYHHSGNPVVYKGKHYRSLARCAREHLKSDYAMQKLIELEGVANAKTE